MNKHNNYLFSLNIEEEPIVLGKYVHKINFMPLYICTVTSIVGYPGCGDGKKEDRM